MNEVVAVAPAPPGGEPKELAPGPATGSAPSSDDDNEQAEPFDLRRLICGPSWSLLFDVDAASAVAAAAAVVVDLPGDMSSEPEDCKWV